MNINIEGVPHVTDKKQQEIGQALLITLAHYGEVNGVTIRFEETW